MAISLMPLEIMDYILSFSLNQEGTGIKDARQVVNLSLVNKKFNQLFSEKLKELKINHLINKYSKYNSDHMNAESDPNENPQLLDALFTGYGSDKSTFPDYTSEIEQDIKDIAVLIPQSMNCILGTLRCRREVPPLAVACVNTKIPPSIVEFLLQRGANPNATVKVDTRRGRGRPVRLIDDLKEMIGPERLAAIEALFNKYAASQ